MKMLFTLFLLFPLLSSADELKVHYLVRHFTLTYTAQEIGLKGSNIDLSIKKKDCSDRIFKNFSDELKDISKPVNVSSAKEKVTYVLNGKTYSIPLDSRLGLFLVNLPEEMKRIKIEENIRCSN